MQWYSKISDNLCGKEKKKIGASAQVWVQAAGAWGPLCSCSTEVGG